MNAHGTSQAAAGGAIEAVQVPPYLDGAATACRADSVDRFDLTVAALLGHPWPQPIELPGRVHRIAIPDDDVPLDRAELLASSESAATVALLLGLSATRVHALRHRMQATHHTPRTGAGPGAQGINAAGTKDQNGNH